MIDEPAGRAPVRIRLRRSLAATTAAFGAGHLPGAINLPPESVDGRAQRRIPDPSTEVIVYCSDVTCDSSVVVAKRLIELGYENVSHYAEGKNDWVAAGLPLEDGRAASNPAR